METLWLWSGLSLSSHSRGAVCRIMKNPRAALWRGSNREELRPLANNHRNEFVNGSQARVRALRAARKCGSQRGDRLQVLVCCSSVNTADCFSYTCGVHFKILRPQNPP